MLKTIKTTKQMRFDELAKYVWDNDLDKVEAISRSGRFKVKFIDKKVILNESQLGNSPFGTTISLESTVWELEIEEPITGDTKLEGVQEVYIDRDDQRIEIESFRGRYSINEILDEHDVSTDSLQIYAMINGKKELVWERNEE